MEPSCRHIDPNREQVTTSVGREDLRTLGLHRLDLIRIGVAGHEIRALRGFGSLAALGVHDLVADFWPALLKANGHEPVELLKLIASEGFNIVASHFGARLNVLLRPEFFEHFAAETAAAAVGNSRVLLLCQREP